MWAEAVVCNLISQAVVGFARFIPVALAFVHAALRPGERLVVRGPRNAFPSRGASELVFAAGAIGFTPHLPMIVEAAARRGAP
jgi:ferredoxin-NADP reductase